MSAPNPTGSVQNSVSVPQPTALLFFQSSQDSYRRPLLSENEVFCGPDAVAREAAGRVIGVKTPVGDFDVTAILRKLPRTQQPEMVVVKADATGRNFPRNLGVVKCPRILIVGDTHHLDRPLRRLIEYARSEPFDFVILDHTRHHARFFAEAGLKNLHWIPALDYGYVPRPLKADTSRKVTFVGQTGRYHPYRVAVLDQVRTAGIPLEVLRGTLDQTADFYADSEITLNVSLNGDLNLRVFEALSAGGFLLTDELPPESGLPLLFQAGKHLDTWRTSEELVDKIRYYLAHPQEARAIRAAGQAEINRAHHPQVKLREFYDLVFRNQVNPAYDLRRESWYLPGATSPAIDFATRLGAYEALQELHRGARQVTLVSVAPTTLAETVGLPRVRVASGDEAVAAPCDWSNTSSSPRVLIWSGAETEDVLLRFTGRRVLDRSGTPATGELLAAWGYAPVTSDSPLFQLVRPALWLQQAWARNAAELVRSRLTTALPEAHVSSDCVGLAGIAEQLGELQVCESALEQAIALDRRNLAALLAYAAFQMDRDRPALAVALEEAARVQPLPPEVEALRAGLFNEFAGHPTFSEYYRIIGRTPTAKAAKPLSLLVITNLFPPQELGGYGRSIWEFAHALRAKGHSVSVLTADEPAFARPPVEEEIEMEQLVDRGLQLYGTWREGRAVQLQDRNEILRRARQNIARVETTVDRLKPDFVLAGNLDFLNMAVVRPALERQIPVIQSIGNAQPGYGPDDQPRESIYCAASCSNWNGSQLRDAGYNPPRLETVYPGARVDRFFQFFLPDIRQLRICFAGLVLPFKGPDVLLQALVMLHRAGLEFTAEIAGEAPKPAYLDELRRLVRENGLESRVSFTGYLNRTELAALFARNNVLVFPTQIPEGFGISQVEAMAAGLVVVTSATGGAREVVRDGVDGIHFQLGQPADLAEKLAALARDPARFSSLQRAAQGRALAFTVAQSADKIEAIACDLAGSVSALTTASAKPAAVSSNETPFAAAAGRHVLVCTDDPDAGGVAQYNHALLCGLAQAGYRVTCLQSRSESPLIAEQSARGVKHSWLEYHTGKDFGRTLTDASEISRVIVADRPDVVLFSDCCPMSNFAAREAVRRAGIPYVVVIGFVGEYLARNFAAKLPQLAQQYADAREVVAVSKDNLDLLHRCFGLPVGKGRVIHYGRPERFFAPPDQSTRARLRRELNIPANAIACLTAARLTGIKRFDLQLEAISALNARPAVKDLHFVWLGDGDQRAELEGAIARLGLEPRVHLLGARSDVAEWLDAADIFILPSEMEGMPLAIMEAMAKGLPVIATSVSGIPEELAETGRLLADPKADPKGVVSGLIEAINLWTDQPTLRAEAGQACRARAMKLFREEMMVSRTLELVGPASPAASAAACRCSDTGAGSSWAGLRTFESREEMLKSLPKGGRWMECGVFRGDFSDSILNACRPDHLTLVDSWEGLIYSGDANGNNPVQIDGNALHRSVVQRFAHQQNVTVRRMYSTRALEALPDAHLDGIYIDADHSYEGCRRDLELAGKKVKPGGWICGHDYLINGEKAERVYKFGVRAAVDEFCRTHGYSIAALAMDGYVSFAIRRPAPDQV